jgi:predicted RNA binding protein YcfA (HicA-like mRNA interferase family)
MKPMKARKLFKIFEDAGWILDRIDGSHHVYVKDGRAFPIPGPANREVDPGTVRKALKILKEDAEIRRSREGSSRSASPESAGPPGLDHWNRNSACCPLGLHSLRKST